MGKEETIQDDCHCRWGPGWMDDCREMGLRERPETDSIAPASFPGLLGFWLRLYPKAHDARGIRKIPVCFLFYFFSPREHLWA